MIALCGVFASLFPCALSGQDAAVIAAARNGGLVFVCRHAITDESFNELVPVDYADSLTQRRLSMEGERQSRDIGTAVRRSLSRSATWSPVRCTVRCERPS
jgi:hypothetical protein